VGIISVPTTVIVGELDIATTPDRAEAIAEAIPGAKLVRIPGAGHHSPLENPEAVTAALREHFARAE
jgi:pimeloyl-ACP methyl ester carboxylesterase